MCTEHRQSGVFYCAERWFCKAMSNISLLNGSQPRLKYTRVNSWVGERSAKTREAGTGSDFLTILHSYSVLPLLPVSPLEGRDTSECKRMCGRVPSSQVASMPNGHLPISHASLAASKADGDSSIIDWLVQLCPSCDLQTSHFLSCCITLLSLAAA